MVTNGREYHVGLPCAITTSAAGMRVSLPLSIPFFFSWEGEAREAAKGKIRDTGGTDKSISCVPEHAKDIVV